MAQVSSYTTGLNGLGCERKPACFVPFPCVLQYCARKIKYPLVAGKSFRGPETSIRSWCTSNHNCVVQICEHSVVRSDVGNHGRAPDWRISNLPSPLADWWLFLLGLTLGPVVLGLATEASHHLFGCIDGTADGARCDRGGHWVKRVLDS